MQFNKYYDTLFIMSPKYLTVQLYGLFILFSFFFFFWARCNEFSAHGPMPRNCWCPSLQNEQSEFCSGAQDLCSDRPHCLILALPSWLSGGKKKEIRELRSRERRRKRGARTERVKSLRRLIHFCLIHLLTVERVFVAEETKGQ